MQKFTRFLKLLPILVLAVVLLTTAALAADETFDKENFVGLVLKNTEPDTVSVKLYLGYPTNSKNEEINKLTVLTPKYEETTETGVNYYYEVSAKSRYYCVAKPITGTARYNDQYCIYITEEEATQQTLLDVTPQRRTGNGWDTPLAVLHYTDETMTNIYKSDPALWPQYADMFTTPAFQTGRYQHRQTTQTELTNFINGLNDADDKMSVYIIGQSMGNRPVECMDIPMVVFTTTDLSSADTLEEAAELVKANGKLTVLYQAQIHGDEPAACEAALGMIKRFDGAYGDGLLDTMNICVIPRLNPCGAFNSRREGELSDGTIIDPNRDFMKLLTLEVQARTRVYNLFEPEVVFDNHEYQVTTQYNRIKWKDMSICCHPVPTFTQAHQDAAVALAYAAFGQLEKDGLTTRWYSDSMGSVGHVVGSGNTAYRGSIHILMETDGCDRGLQFYERRVVAHASAVGGILAYLDENADAVNAAVNEQWDLIVENGKTYEEDDIIILDGTSSDSPENYLKGKYIQLDSGTIESKFVDFTATYPNVIKRSRPAPTAYVIPAGESYTDAVLDLVEKHGISYYNIPANFSVNLQQYTALAEVGGVKVADLTTEAAVSFPNGAYVFTMDQKNAIILAGLMEPDLTDSLANTLVGQGIITEADGVYPIYRYTRDLNAKGEIDSTKLDNAPKGLEAVGATKIGGTGKITGLDAAIVYEYRAADAFAYTAVAAGATEIADLPVGTYYVRVAATADAEPSAETVVEIGYGVLDEYVVYLDSTNGAADNDGYTEATPVNTHALAYSQLTALMETAPAGTTGKIVVVGTYTITNTDCVMEMPKHSFPVLITGGKLVYKDGSGNKYLQLGGDTTFDNITLKTGSNSNSYYLAAMGHKLVIGEDVTTELHTSGTGYYFYICGGGSSATVAKTDVTVLSGSWATVYAGGRDGKVTGDCKLVVKNSSVTRVTPARSCAIGGDVHISLENVESLYNLIGGNNTSGNVSGDVTMVLGEGVIAPAVYAGSYTAGNVGGTVTIVADGIDLTQIPVYGKAYNAGSTIGGLKLVLNKGQLVDVADTFVTRDGVDIVLGCDQTEAVTLPYSCNLDLNGNDATITVADGKILTVWDSSTDDFDVLDKNGNRTYGILNATGNAVAKEGYLVREETTGKSYHRKSLELGGVTLRPAIGGIYYTGQFGLNELCRDNVACYGVVLSIKENPELDKEGCEHSTLTTWPQDGTGHGTVLSGIMKKDGGFTANSRNAATKVYGVAYIKYTDGTVEYSEAASFSLQELVEYSDAMWQGLDQTQKDGLLELYSGFKSVMKFWNIPNIKAA